MRSLLIVGQGHDTHIGGSFCRAAGPLGLDARLVDAREAFAGPAWLRAISWHAAGRRPLRLRDFGRKVLEVFRAARPEAVLSTGIAPLDVPTLRALSAEGARRLLYLTDDPWNPAHRAPWFLATLPFYDRVCTPRRANEADLRLAGCPRVDYLPFAYDPDLFFPEEPAPAERAKFVCDVMVAGHADPQRVPYVRALAEARLTVGLYGAGWERYREIAALSRGQADPRTLRLATRASRAALCLVRRANRDGHVMRSFEIPAIGGACPLVEATDEHREIFGPDGRTALYFSGPAQMKEKALWLLSHEEDRRRMALEAHRQVTAGPNTYRDRLRVLIED